jgi:hypothetical protein
VSQVYENKKNHKFLYFMADSQGLCAACFLLRTSSSFGFPLVWAISKAVGQTPFDMVSEDGPDTPDQIKPGN